MVSSGTVSEVVGVDYFIGAGSRFIRFIGLSVFPVIPQDNDLIAVFRRGSPLLVGVAGVVFVVRCRAVACIEVCILSIVILVLSVLFFCSELFSQGNVTRPFYLCPSLKGVNISVIAIDCAGKTA